MIRDTTQTTRHLVRALKLRDLILFNLVAVLGLRHLGTTAKFGPGSLLMWVIAAVFFFIPQGLAVIELSSRFPKEGGIYFWTKSALGEGHGFLCGWCYWINNVLYYPNLLISAAVIATFVFGKSGSGLSESWAYVLPLTLGTLWIAVLINIVGLGTGKWLQNAGGVGTYVPGLILILLGVYGAMTAPPANELSLATLKPDLNNLPALNLLASIAFAFAGLELASTMADEVEDPRRNLPRSIFISAPLIAVVYVVGTAAVLWRLPNNDVNVVSGFLQAIKAGADNISPTLSWVAPVCAALYSIGNLGSVGAWLIGPCACRVRNRAGSILPESIRSGASALAHAVCRDPRSGNPRDDISVALGAREGHERRGCLSDPARHPDSNLLHPVPLFIHHLFDSSPTRRELQ